MDQEMDAVKTVDHSTDNTRVNVDNKHIEIDKSLAEETEKIEIETNNSESVLGDDNFIEANDQAEHMENETGDKDTYTDEIPNRGHNGNTGNDGIKEDNSSEITKSMMFVSDPMEETKELLLEALSLEAVNTRYEDNPTRIKRLEGVHFTSPIAIVHEYSMEQSRSDDDTQSLSLSDDWENNGRESLTITYDHKVLEEVRQDMITVDAEGQTETTVNILKSETFTESTLNKEVTNDVQAHTMSPTGDCSNTLVTMDNLVSGSSVVERPSVLCDSPHEPKQFACDEIRSKRNTQSLSDIMCTSLHGLGPPPVLSEVFSKVPLEEITGVEDLMETFSENEAKQPITNIPENDSSYYLKSDSPLSQRAHLSLTGQDTCIIQVYSELPDDIRTKINEEEFYFNNIADEPAQTSDNIKCEKVTTLETIDTQEISLQASKRLKMQYDSIESEIFLVDCKQAVKRTHEEKTEDENVHVLKQAKFDDIVPTDKSAIQSNEIETTKTAENYGQEKLKFEISEELDTEDEIIVFQQSAKGTTTTTCTTMDKQNRSAQGDSMTDYLAPSELHGIKKDCKHPIKRIYEEKTDDENVHVLKKAKFDNEVLKDQSSVQSNEIETATTVENDGQESIVKEDCIFVLTQDNNSEQNKCTSESIDSREIVNKIEHVAIEMNPLILCEADSEDIADTFDQEKSGEKPCLVQNNLVETNNVKEIDNTEAEKVMPNVPVVSKVIENYTNEVDNFVPYSLKQLKFEIAEELDTEDEIIIFQQSAKGTTTTTTIDIQDRNAQVGEPRKYIELESNNDLDGQYENKENCCDYDRILVQNENTDNNKLDVALPQGSLENKSRERDSYCETVKETRLSDSVNVCKDQTVPLCNSPVFVPASQILSQSSQESGSTGFIYDASKPHPYHSSQESMKDECVNGKSDTVTFVEKRFMTEIAEDGFCQVLVEDKPIELSNVDLAESICVNIKENQIDFTKEQEEQMDTGILSFVWY